MRKEENGVTIRRWLKDLNLNTISLLLFGTFLASPFVLSSTAQPITTFETKVGGSGQEIVRDLVQTSDSGYIAAGSSTSNGNGGEDVYIVRLDENGDTIWTRTHGGPDDEGVHSIRPTTTADEGFILAGYTWSFGAGGMDHYLLRIDSVGDTLWTRTYGTVENDKGYYAIETSDGGFLTVGWVDSLGWSKGHVIKTDDQGNEEWNSIIPSSANSHASYCLENDSGQFIIAGKAKQSGTDFDLHLRKFDSSGTVLTSKEYDDPYSSGNVNNGFVIEPTHDGGYMVGAVTGISSSFDAWMVKTDAKLDTLWSERLWNEFTLQFVEYGYRLMPTPDKGFILAGTKNSGDRDVKLVKTDSLANIEWTRTFGGGDGDYSYAVQVTHDGGYVVSGLADVYQVGVGDAYILKLDSSGQLGCLLGSSASVLSDHNGYGVSCAGGTDGVAAVEATDGTAPFSYDWGTASGNQSTDTASGLGAGTYTVTVTDDQGCQDSAEITLAEPSPLGLTTSSTDEICGNANGSATVSVSGGVSPYVHQWDDPENQTNATADSLASGGYTDLVTDANGCQANATVTVDPVDGPSVSIIDSGDVVGCNGDSTGWAIASVSGGTTPYSYQWDDPNGQTAPAADSLAAGQWTITVTDSNACTDSAGLILSEPSELEAITSSAPDSGSCDGSALVVPSGGTTPYTFQWGSATGDQTTETATGLCDGEYCVTVSDSNGCTLDTCVSVSTWVGIQEYRTDDRIVLYPNPSEGELNFEGLPSGARVRISDNVGRLVKTCDRPSSCTLAGHPDGLYHVHVVTEEGVRVKKMLIRR